MNEAATKNVEQLERTLAADGSIRANMEPGATLCRDSPTTYQTLGDDMSNVVAGTHIPPYRQDQPAYNDLLATPFAGTYPQAMTEC